MYYFTDEEKDIINGTYGTAYALKMVLKNMFNVENHPSVDLQKCLLSDLSHRELFFKILDMPIEYINGREIIQDFFKVPEITNTYIAENIIHPK
jgi:hypothetical protein